MNLPKQAQRQLDNALAIEAALAQQQAEQAPVAQTVAALVEPPPEAPPEPVVAAPQPPAPPAAPKSPDNFEHKYRVLQGMYESDVKRVKEAQKLLDARLEAIETAPPPAAPEPNAKDVETFGADLIEMVKRYAESQSAGVNARLQALEQKVGIVASQTQTQAKNSFFNELTRLAPDWEAINDTDEWKMWLGEKDALFGAARQEALDHAQANGDVKRVAGFFQAYKASLPAPALDTPSELAQQITPSTTGSPPVPRTQPPKPFLSEKAVTDFYNDVSRGRYVGRETEAARLEAEINLAVAEGRVR